MSKAKQIWAKQYKAPEGEKGKLSLTITAQTETEAEIRILGIIAPWWNDADTFRVQVENLAALGYRTITLYVKTEGGSCVEANEIGNIIEDFPGEVYGQGGSMVASAGTYILTKCKTVSLPKNGLYMVHKPETHFIGNEDQVEADLKILKAITKDYVSVYSAKTGMSEEEVRTKLQSDYWMTAEEARAEGWIDEVRGEADYNMDDITALRELKYPNVAKVAAMVKPDSKDTPTPETNSNTNTDMDKKVLCAKLGLSAEASEAEITAKLDELNQNTSELGTLKTAQANAEKERKKLEIKAFLDNAQNKDKKFTAEQRPHFEALADSNFDACKAAVESLPGITAVTAQLNTPPSGGAAPAGREGWKYDDWMAKDSKGLNAMRTEKPEQFTALYKDKYGVEPPQASN